MVKQCGWREENEEEEVGFIGGRGVWWNGREGRGRGGRMWRSGCGWDGDEIEIGGEFELGFGFDLEFFGFGEWI